MSLQAKTKIDSTSPFHVYYNIDLFNNKVDANESPTPIVFNEARTNPYINCPNNYFVSIIRFQIDTPSLPVMLPIVELGQTDVNKTIYKIFMSYLGTTYEQRVMYQPSDFSIPPPVNPLTAQDVSTNYYYVYSIQSWLDMVNKAFSDCFAQITSPPVGAYAPFVKFDVNTSLIELYTDDHYRYDAGSPINIYFNNALYTLFDSIPKIRERINGVGAFYNRIKIQKNFFTTLSPPIGDFTLVTKQETTTIGLMNPVKNIVFKVSQLPISSELVAPPSIFGQNASLFNGGNNSNISPVLTDFIVPISNGNTYKETIEYNAQVYRLMDLFGSSPLSALELTVFWQDKYGGMHPLLLNSGCGCSIKIMFRRKDFNAVDIGL